MEVSSEGKDNSSSCGTLPISARSTDKLELGKLEKNGKTQDKNIRTMQLATTDLDALLHVAKSSLGTGLLAMPFAFKHAGVIEGLISTIIVGLICAHGTHLLVKTSQRMCQTLKKTSLGYADTVEAVFSSSRHTRLQSKASLVRKTVNMFLFLTYYGAEMSYVVFIAATLKEVTYHNLGYDMNIRLYMIMAIPPLLIIGTVRSMKYLVPFSMLANMLLLSGVVFISYYVLQDLPPLSSRPNYIPITKFPIFFSTVICGLEGIGTILPVENSMRNPHHFLGCPGVLNIAMSIVVSLFTTVGFFGYWKYGDAVRDTITLSLPEGYVASTVKLLVALAIMFTYGLQMSAVMEVVWSAIEKKFESKNLDVAYYSTRASFVIVTVLSSIAVPQLGPILSLVGAVGFSTLGLFIPAAVDTILLSESHFSFTNWLVWKNMGMMALAVFALITGSYLSIETIIVDYS
ncbi:proton-coupled amino acid transporter-like protein pathetic isoform X3 [Nilaparvata lugens]|uniref:proton-coupled amino acid transporter-like protein pathetic isoform X1 n=1 Tax=Nilaparvata lugens TaxID=108931 RepID=UPI00193D3FF7|nr:proton-coupled amino acid transporter-like protein pathetic isoform X1 [Nilaparvata lugens]XP_039281264.1 proton-coupled amino acid transporter-like protein pathetic isoform X2 [Nilaparvata lugens]XP_039281265.1 proton-coupled amino acid transporter-like protein pathetic isoform X3 [Nilaparvata lugens]